MYLNVYQTGANFATLVSAQLFPGFYISASDPIPSVLSVSITYVRIRAKSFTTGETTMCYMMSVVLTGL